MSIARHQAAMVPSCAPCQCAVSITCMPSDTGQVKQLANPWLSLMRMPGEESTYGSKRRHQ